MLSRYQFQSTPPRGGRPRVRSVGKRAIHVSIHAPAWGATWLDPRCWPRSMRFNPRPRVGGDRRGVEFILLDVLFQSTPPRGGRPPQATTCFAWTKCFNPRPRVGGDNISLRFGLCNQVSIHAPAWGATSTLRTWPGRSAFQSTPPRGGRLGHAGSRAYRRSVSIHAPAWGATALVERFSAARHCFNPRPRVGGDGSGAVLHAAAVGFNPRPRVGGDYNGNLVPTSVTGFNPRPRVGGDTCTSASTVTMAGFNPRPRVGGDCAGLTLQ